MFDCLRRFPKTRGLARLWPACGPRCLLRARGAEYAVRVGRQGPTAKWANQRRGTRRAEKEPRACAAQIWRYLDFASEIFTLIIAPTSSIPFSPTVRLAGRTRQTYRSPKAGRSHASNNVDFPISGWRRIKARARWKWSCIRKASSPKPEEAMCSRQCRTQPYNHQNRSASSFLPI